MAFEKFLAVNAQEECKEGVITPDLEVYHAFDGDIPLGQWQANIGMKALTFKFFDVSVHAKPPDREFNVIDDNTSVGAISGGNCPKRVLDTASASTAFTKFSHA